MQDFDHIAIEKLNLSRRTYHALARSRILTLGNLRQFYKDKDKHQIRNIGQKSLDEISKVLEELPNNFSLLSQAEKKPAQLSFQEDVTADKTIQLPIDVLGLSASVRGKLKQQGIKTIDELRKAPDFVLLNINLIGSKKLAEIRQLLDDFVDNTKTTITDKHITVVEKRNVTWAQIVESYFRNEKHVYSYILISRFGFSPRTLEEIAVELGVTRERVRQIQEAVAVRYLKHIRFSGALGLLARIETIFSTYGDGLSLVGLKTILKKEDMLGQFSETVKTEHIKDLDLLETLFCWLSLISNKKYTLHPIEFSVDISSLAKSGKISIRDHGTLMNISTKERRKIRRKVLFTGGITIKVPPSGN